MNWFTKRILQAVFTVFAVITLTFGMIRLLPGGPMDFLKAKLLQQNPQMSTREINALVSSYTNIEPAKPLWQQYIDYLLSLAQGDLGKSVWHDEPVAAILGEALPWTVFLMSISLFLIFLIGISLGALMAYKEGSNFDTGFTSLSIFLNSIPYYVAAVILVYVLGYQFSYFPTGGRVASDVTAGFNVDFIVSVFYHAALPITSLVLTEFGFQALNMRGNSIRVLGEDYLRVARLRGLSENRIAFRYVARNAILPMYTQLMISIGFMFGGAVILEEIFTYTGVGYYIFQSVSARDYPLMMGGFILITLAVVLGVFIADLTYGKLDPRAGRQSASTSIHGRFDLGRLIRNLKRKIRQLTGQSVAAGVADGGAVTATGDVDRPDLAAGSPFGRTADTDVSRTDEIKRFFEISILTPFRVMWSDWRARIGVAVLILYGLMGTLGVWLVEPPTTTGPRLLGPFTNWAYPLGTDNLGRGLFTMIVHATPAMFKMILAGAVFTTVVATLVGTVSGYVGGKVDRALMSFNDVAMTIPGLPLIIVLAVILEPRNPYFVGIILSVNAWAGLARSIRSQVLTLREMSYVEASRLMGLSTNTVVQKDLIPNLMPYIFVNFVSSARRVIFASVGLYFLGILPFNQLNWGVIMNFAYSSGGALYSWDAAHWLFFPMLTIVILSFALILLAQGTDRIFNPRVRARHSKSITTEESGETQ